jgi:hypothetical protein
MLLVQVPWTRKVRKYLSSGARATLASSIRRSAVVLKAEPNDLPNTVGLNRGLAQLRVDLPEKGALK